MIKQRKDGICKNRKEKATQEKITIQHEEINQKVLVKETILKRYRQRVKQYRQNKRFQNNERNSINNREEMTLKHTNKPDAKETE